MKTSNLIVLAASGRSGTTWVQNILAAPLNYRLLFEPLHRRVSGNDEFDRLYLGRDDHHEGLHKYLTDALNGRIKDRWLLQGGQEELRYFHRNRWWARNTVLKMIRAHFLLEWFEKNFPCRIVYLVRHPCAAIASRIKAGWGSKAQKRIDYIMSQDELVRKYFEPYRDIIETRNSTLAQRNALLWCLENKVLLTLFPDKDWVGGIYEYLYLKPREELDRIYSSLDIKRPSCTERKIDKIAYTSRQDSAVRMGEDNLKRWDKELSDDEIAQILEIVQAFDIGIYDRGQLPVGSEVERIMKIRSPL